MGCRFTIYFLFMDIHNSFLDVQNSFLDIHNIFLDTHIFFFGYRKIDLLISLIRLNFGYP